MVTIMFINNNLAVVFSLLTAILISYLLMPVIMRINYFGQKDRLNDGDLFQYEKYISSLGGGGIFVTILITYAAWGNLHTINSYPFLVSGIFLLLLIDIKDEFIWLMDIQKPVIKVVAAIFLSVFGNLAVPDLYGLLGLNELSWFWGNLLSVGIILLTMQAFQYVNKVDSLAGGLGIIISFIFAVWFWSFGFYAFSILSIIISGALIGFIIFNISPTRIRMRNSDALAVGFIMAYLFLLFIIVNSNPATGPLMKNAHVFGFSVILIPIVDMLRNWTIKIFYGYDSFRYKRETFYYQLLRSGMSKEIAIFTIWIASLFLIGITYFVSFFEINFNLGISILLSLLIIPIIKSQAYLSLFKRIINSLSNSRVEYNK